MKQNITEIKSKEKKEDLEDIKKKLYEFVIKYEKSYLTKDELQDFCFLMINYCKLTKYMDCSLETPDIVFEELKPKIWGQYNRETNTVTINDLLLSSVLRKGKSLSDLVCTIGHEMMHYRQNSQMLDYDNLSDEEQRLIDDDSKKLLAEYKNYIKLGKEDVKMLHTLLAPYLKENEVPLGYTSIEDFYTDISSASYFTLLVEQEARTEEFEFARDFYNDLLKSHLSLSTLFIRDRVKKNIKIMKKSNDIANEILKEKFDKFSKLYDINEEELLEIAKNVEGKKGSLEAMNYTSYQFAMNYLLQNRTIEQKESLLKNVIFNGYEIFLGVLIESIEKDVNFKSNKKSISNLVCDCLTGFAYENEDPKTAVRPYNAFYMDYSKMLTQEDFERAITELVKQDFIGSYRAKTLIVYSKDFKTISLETVLKCQENTFNRETRTNEGKCRLKEDEALFKALFSRVTMEDKINYLKSGQLQPRIREILLCCIKQDVRYDSFKNEIESIISKSYAFE